MKPNEIFFVALGAEADKLAAELARELTEDLSVAEAGYGPDYQPLQASLAPRLCGWVGTAGREAGIEPLPAEQGRGELCQAVYKAAIERQPDALIFIGETGVNHKIARAIKAYLCRHHGPFFNWEPKLVDLPTESKDGAARERDFDCRLVLNAGAVRKSFAQEAAREITRLMEGELMPR